VRAAAARGRQALGVEERPLPEPGSGEARVRLEACGICGSDLHFYHADLWQPGHTPGHEMVGRVEALGPDTAGCGLREGQRVAVEPLLACGDCEACRAGRYNVCRQLRLQGVQAPGGLCEALAAPTPRLHPVAEDLDPAVAALTEPVAVAVHGLRRGRFEPGQRVLILGAGAVGLVTAIAARALGAGEVWISARHAHQAERCRALGATRVLREEEAGHDALLALARETDFHLVVESVGGSADTVRDACAAVAPGGTISVLGVFLGPVAVDPLWLLMREGTLAWSNCYDAPGGRADFADAARLVEDERERLAPLVTHRRPLAEVDDAFRLAADKSSGAVKVSVTLP